jgi:hypothetical protein
MSHAAKSVFAVGALLIGLGVAFALAPAVPAAVLGFAAGAEPVVRILGVVVSALGAYYLIASSREDRTVIRASVPVRAVAGTGLLLLVASGAAGLPVLAFVLLEYGGALWTWAASRRGARASGERARQVA